MSFSILRNSLKLGKNVSKIVLKNAKLDLKNNSKVLASNQHIMFLTPLPQINPVLARHYSSKSAKTHHARKYQSSSESDSDLDEWLGRRGNTDFWRRKMPDRFVDLGHMSEKHTKEFYHVIQDLWEKQFGEISPYNLVPIQKFMENMHHVLNDRVLVRRAHSFLPYLFKAVDKDRSGEISVEEFKLFFDVLGLEEQDAIVAFRAIDSNADGKINSKEFVKHGRDFFLSEDEENLSKYFWGPLVHH
ncbi:hypothetical protein GWI33_003217 [Rhynchophorus ferrugineus]|uniref:EF-hand domain-containing protein n=1 Tax=Rhynchophorus ferrugineus TaxID=354439 RepID=A0A834IQC4_RHYFE|nr:hypothetical protein GWI33_003217 [Rhynchophorus ferrugineus]